MRMKTKTTPQPPPPPPPLQPPLPQRQQQQQLQGPQPQECTGEDDLPALPGLIKEVGMKTVGGSTTTVQQPLLPQPQHRSRRTGTAKSTETMRIFTEIGKIRTTETAGVRTGTSKIPTETAKIRTATAENRTETAKIRTATAENHTETAENRTETAKISTEEGESRHPDVTRICPEIGKMSGRSPLGRRAKIKTR